MAPFCLLAEEMQQEVLKISQLSSPLQVHIQEAKLFPLET